MKLPSGLTVTAAPGATQASNTTTVERLAVDVRVAVEHAGSRHVEDVIFRRAYASSSATGGVPSTIVTR